MKSALLALRFVFLTSSVYLARPKKRSHLRCWLTKHGTGGRRMFPQRPAQNALPSLERFPVLDATFGRTKGSRSFAALRMTMLKCTGRMVLVLTTILFV